MQAKVSIVRCASYADAHRAVSESISLLGGLPPSIRNGATVAIKPNLLTDRAPEQAVTTHPEIVRAAIRLVRDAGAKPFVADCPANVVKLERVWERTGMTALCAEENVPLLNLEKEGSRTFTVDGVSFSIAAPLLDAAAIINLPKVKTHTLTTLTCAMKNLFGYLPGFQKAMMHKTYPTPDDFARVILAINKAHPPALNIADGVVGMDGEGPGAGNLVEMGFVAASTDTVAMDLALCRALHVNPKAVAYLAQYLHDPRWQAMQTVGVPVDEVMPGKFNVPSTFKARMVPRPLVKLLAPLVWIRPGISEKCVLCGLCAKACPADALRLEQSRATPLLDARKCIGCCCCHEVCPEKAITMTLSPFLRLMRGGKLP